MARLRSPSYAAASRCQSFEFGSGNLEVGSRNAEVGKTTEAGRPMTEVRLENLDGGILKEFWDVGHKAQSLRVDNVAIFISTLNPEP
jgi:hypothetical protein